MEVLPQLIHRPSYHHRHFGQRCLYDFGYGLHPIHSHRRFLFGRGEEVRIGRGVWGGGRGKVLCDWLRNGNALQ